MKCLICQKEFKFKKGRKTKFCSQICYKKWRKEKDPKLRPKIKCLYCDKENPKSRWYLKRGEGKFCNVKCYGKYLTKLWKKQPELSPNWRGGIENPRVDTRWEKWRKSILKRDNYQCLFCNSKEKLEIHHLLPFSKFPELRYKKWNGITLCQKCHRNFTKHFPAQRFIKFEDFLKYEK